MGSVRKRADSPSPGVKQENPSLEKAEVLLPSGKRQRNVTRRRTDYYCMAGFYIAFWVFSQKTWPNNSFTTPADRENLLREINIPFGFADPLGSDLWKVGVAYPIFSSLSISLVVIIIFLIMYTISPEKTYSPVFWEQLQHIAMNCGLFLPLTDGIATALIYKGWFKVFVNEPPYSVGEYTILYHIRDIVLWVLVFELTWYMQHRAMHDNKFLWKHGHEYHHQWRKPEHMIGITNFAFDHIVEVWVTMSSSYIPMLIFPIHLWAFRAIGFLYMVLAVLVHWDLCPIRYHLNHHYLVIKNYGSHVPIFDMLFGTYQWGSYFPNGDDEKYPGFKPTAGNSSTERKDS